jgi:hypothetical protein
LRDAVIDRVGGDRMRELEAKWQKLSNQLREKLIAQQYPAQFVNTYLNAYKRRYFPTLVRLDRTVNRYRQAYKMRHPDVARLVNLWYARV